MSRNKWMYALCMAVLLSLGPKAFADHDHDGDHGHGHANGHDKDKHDRDDDRGDRGSYRDHDRELRGWYAGHRDHLPPGLAKRDELLQGWSASWLCARPCLRA
jgi:hypothetical protein